MVKETESKKGFWATWPGKTVSFIGKYTGISWVLGKISSGWNSLKNWWSGNDATAAESEGKTPKQGNGTGTEQKLQPYIEVTNDELVLVVPKEHVFNANPEKPLEYMMYIAIGENKFRITGINDSLDVRLVKDDGDGKIINSAAKQDGSDVSGELEKMKNLLGFDGETTEVKITEISDVPFKAPEVEPAKDSEAQLTDPNSEQHLAGNKSQSPAGNRI